METTSQAKVISLEMWPDRCQPHLGLRCDCVLQYVTLAASMSACWFLVMLGGVCISGVQDACLLDQRFWGVVWITIGLTFFCVYAALFLSLGEIGRKFTGLRMRRMG